MYKSKLFNSFILLFYLYYAFLYVFLITYNIWLHFQTCVYKQPYTYLIFVFMFAFWFPFLILVFLQIFYKFSVFHNLIDVVVFEIW